MALTYIDSFEYSHGWRDIVNDVKFSVSQRTPASEVSVVWETDTPIELPTGQSTTVTVQASDPFLNAEDLVAGTDIVTSGLGVPTVTLSRRSGQSTTLTITATGGDLTITHLQLRAVSVPVARTIDVTDSSTTSISRHGLRTYGQDAPWAGRHDARAVASILLAQYAERRPIVQLPLVSSDPAHHLQIVTRAISDLVTIRNSELGLNADFHIETISHRLARMVGQDECPGPVHYGTLGCERSGVVVATNPFTFDVAGKGFDQGQFGTGGTDDPSTVFIFDHPVQGQFDVGLFGT
jgi:hypothetical protein